MPNLMDYVNKNKELELNKFGTFTIEDFLILAKDNRDSVKMF